MNKAKLEDALAQALAPAFVAMSRCRTFEGIALKSAIRERDIFTNTAVEQFMTHGGIV